MALGKLALRIGRQPGNARAHMAAWQPHPTAPQPDVMPLAAVYVTGDATVVEQCAPLVTDHGVIPATSAGQWDQVRAL